MALKKMKGSASLKKPSATTINLIVVGPDGGKKDFRMNKGWVLRELMSAYSFFWNEHVTDFVFLFRGRLLKADQNPLQLEMEDGDEIVAQKRWT